MISNDTILRNSWYILSTLLGFASDGKVFSTMETITFSYTYFDMCSTLQA